MKIFLISLVLFSSLAHGFNWSRCQNSQPVQGSANGLIELSSTAVSNTAVSVSQGISSWGDCSLLGDVRNVRKTFIAQNRRYLEQDIARGSGEYLAAYARLHECSPAGVREYGRRIKREYFGVAGEDWETVFQKMEEPFRGIERLCPLS